jgi:hypothetical protein
MPWILVYFNEFETRGEAMKRELFFKSIDGYNFLMRTISFKLNREVAKGGSSLEIPFVIKNYLE